MALADLQGAHQRRRRKGCTVGAEGVEPFRDLVGHDFRPQAPNVVWAADITQMRTGEGWLYLAAVQDLFSRRIVDRSMDRHTRQELVVEALKMAVAARKPAKGTIHHSDHAGTVHWPDVRPDVPRRRDRAIDGCRRLMFRQRGRGDILRDPDQGEAPPRRPAGPRGCLRSRPDRTSALVTRARLPLAPEDGKSGHIKRAMPATTAASPELACGSSPRRSPHRPAWSDVANSHIGTVEGADEVVHRHPIRPAEVEDPGWCIGSVDSPEDGVHHITYLERLDQLLPGPGHRDRSLVPGDEGSCGRPRTLRRPVDVHASEDGGRYTGLDQQPLRQRLRAQVCVRRSNIGAYVAEEDKPPGIGLAVPPPQRSQSSGRSPSRSCCRPLVAACQQGG
jgi:transposase InsO family protein